MDDPELLLRCGASEASIDLAHGGAISRLRLGSLDVLAAHPMTDGPRGESTAVNEAAWVNGWPGGWHLLVPNAGGEAPAAVVPQGFHGAASWEAWTVMRGSRSRAVLRWADVAGLRVTRSVGLRRSGIDVRTRVHNSSSRPRPALLAEHLIFGPGLAHPRRGPVELVAPPSADLSELDYETGAPDGDPVPWAEASSWHAVPDRPVSRGAVLTGTGGRFRIRTPSGDLAMRWSAGVLPFAWLWQELEGARHEPWNGNVWAVGVEPSSVADGLGLDHAVANGTASTIGPGGSIHWRTRLHFRAR